MLQKQNICYCPIASDIIKHGVAKKYLGSNNDKTCRFCGKGKRETSFSNEAHVFPQFIGNKKLLSYYECDSCNKIFSEGIENSFANYFLPYNNFFRIRGNKKVPTYISDGNVRVEACSNTDTISSLQKSTSNDFSNFDDDGDLVFTYKMKQYIPILVFKCLVKMSLSIMPECELNGFEDTINWLMDNKNRNFYKDGRRLTLKMTLFRDHHLGSDIKYGLYKNNDPYGISPYMIFVIEWGQMHCMIEVPIEKNIGRVQMEYIPLFLPREIATNRIEHIDLTSSSLIK